MKSERKNPKKQQQKTLHCDYSLGTSGIMCVHLNCCKRQEKIFSGQQLLPMLTWPSALPKAACYTLLVSQNLAFCETGTLTFLSSLEQHNLYMSLSCCWADFLPPSVPKTLLVCGCTKEISFAWQICSINTNINTEAPQRPHSRTEHLKCDLWACPHKEAVLNSWIDTKSC